MKASDALTLERALAGIQFAAQRLARVSGPLRAKSFVFPLVRGGAVRELPVLANETLELTAGTLVDINHRLRAHGIGLALQPIQTRMEADLVEVEAGGARVWLRIDTTKGADDAP